VKVLWRRKKKGVADSLSPRDTQVRTGRTAPVKGGRQNFLKSIWLLNFPLLKMKELNIHYKE
jgi:hypothetical protein